MEDRVAKRATHGDYIEDEEGSMMVVVDSEDQALWFRVGPVYTDGKLDPVQGVWIQYQEKYEGGSLQGPILLSPETFEKMYEHFKKVTTKLDA